MYINYKQSIKFILSLILLSFFCIESIAQEDENDSLQELILTEYVIVDGDTIPFAEIDEVIIRPQLSWTARWRYRRYTKLVRDLKKVYPYARMAREKLDEMEREFQSLQTESERKKYVKTVEKQLMDEFGDDLKHLTIKQGRLLLLLIDRETGNTSYELLQELRGNFSAFFWQAIARLFGSDLKKEYDPDGEDMRIERIIIRIEKGEI